MPKVSLICKECGKEFLATNTQVKRGRKYCSQECYHKRPVWNKGIPRSKETKDKISNTRKEMFANGELKPDFKGRHHSEESKNKQRKKWKEKYEKGYVNPRKGIDVSEETKQKLSETRKELFASGKLIHHMKGKHWSDEIKKKQSKAKKGMYDGGKNPFYGKHHSEESKNKQRKKWKEKYKEGFVNPWRGKTPEEETRKKMREAKKDFIPWNKGVKGLQEAWNKGLSGEEYIKHYPAWWNYYLENGVTLGSEPYGIEFNKKLKHEITLRDKGRCQMCNTRFSDYGFDVHHIDSNKLNNNPFNLILLCKSCHGKTRGRKKKYWTDYFTEYQKKRGIKAVSSGQ